MPRQPSGPWRADASAGPPSVATATTIIIPLTARPVEALPAREARSACAVGATPAAAAPCSARAATTTATDGAAASSTPPNASATSEMANTVPAG